MFVCFSVACTHAACLFSTPDVLPSVDRGAVCSLVLRPCSHNLEETGKTFGGITPTDLVDALRYGRIRYKLLTKQSKPIYGNALLL